MFVVTSLLDEDEMETATETWESVTKSSVVTVRTDHLGQETRVRTRGGQKLMITPEDRALNQERASADEFDPFQNGLLAPVKIVSSDDAEKASTPNHLSSDDVQELLVAPAAEFAERLSSISSAPTLRSLRKAAEDIDVKPSRRGLIDARLEEVSPSPRIESGHVGADG